MGIFIRLYLHRFAQTVFLGRGRQNQLDENLIVAHQLNSMNCKILRSFFLFAVLVPMLFFRSLFAAHFSVSIGNVPIVTAGCLQISLAHNLHIIQKNNCASPRGKPSNEPFKYSRRKYEAIRGT